MSGSFSILYFLRENLARVMELKSKFENMKKGNLSLKEYFLKVKNLVDSLNAAGKPISKEDPSRSWY